jgi:hypothetical protein
VKNIVLRTSPLASLAGCALLFSIGCGGSADDAVTNDDELRAKKTLLCASPANAPVYFGDESQILLEANVSRDGVLANAELKMATKPNLGVRNETWNAQRTYTPSNQRYKGMQKYSSADAWCGYSVIAPPKLNARTGTFSVYVQQACEGGFTSTATLSCKIESRRAVTPDAPSGAATVELRFSSAGKTAAVAAGYYETSAFTGNAIVLASPTTNIDLDQLVPDDDSDSAPASVCYTGDVTKAKKILWAMLGNTDGNGDHYLDDGAKISSRAANALHVEYSVTGEGGSNPRALSVPVCR